MGTLLRIKFSDPLMKKLLILTKPHELKEGNHWHDNFWGACACEGCIDKEEQNMLGLLLMEVREEL
jgi:predicted NAD-dependent protein-ADP-ribosyltransferase YbiA (DUF1768 family)